MFEPEGVTVTDDAGLILTSHNLERRLRKFITKPWRTKLLLTHYGKWVALVTPITDTRELLEFDTGLFVSLNESGYGLYVSLKEFCEHRLEIIDELRGYWGARAAALTLRGKTVLVTPVSDKQANTMIVDAARALRAERTDQATLTPRSEEQRGWWA